MSKNWKKQKIQTNENKVIACWRSTCGLYLIIQNINGGKSTDGRVTVDKDGYQWLYELTKLERNTEKALGVFPSLKEAQATVIVE